MYKIVKRYGHEEGLSCSFRQFRAPETHCSKIHGYALAFEFTFVGQQLDHRNWLISFGELKPLKAWLKDNFDHKTVLSTNDPLLPMFKTVEGQGGLTLNVVREVGCEKFAQMAYEWVVENILDKSEYHARDVRLESVKVSEHGGNSAIYVGN